jgi:regulator of protease activity HflC (stomatin/prohibitin superfamily)
MALIILGLIMWIAGIVIIKQKEELHKLGVGLRIGGLGLLVIGFLTSCIMQIDAGQIGVKSLFGKVENDVLTSGLNIVNPLIDVKVP